MGRKLKLTEEQKAAIAAILEDGGSVRKAAKEVLGRDSKESTIRNYIKQGRIERPNVQNGDRLNQPKVLLLDIETAPNKSYHWGLWNQNIGLNMVANEWFILSYAAKWLGDSPDKIYYKDMRGHVYTEDDTEILVELWNLLNECDIVITQNGKKFDIKKINARFILNGFTPPSSYKHIDTLQIAKSSFGFTSNKLEWMTDKLNVNFKKQDHGKFAGFNLWKGMMEDNLEAFQECEDYNKYDVLSLEELYIKLAAWDKKHPNFNLYHEENKHVCRCGSDNIIKYGFAYTGKSKFQRYRCEDCGAETRDSINLFDKDKRKSLHLNVSDN